MERHERREAPRTRDASGSEGGPSRASERSASGSETGLSDRMSSLRHDESVLVGNSLTGCNEMLSQLEGYSTSLDGLVEAHEDLITKLMRCVKQHQDAQIKLRQNKNDVIVRYQKGKEHQQRIQLALEKLSRATSASEVGVGIDEAEKEMTSLQQWIQECRNQFPDTKVVYCSIKMQNSATTALEEMAQDRDPRPYLLDSHRMEITFQEDYSISEMSRKMVELVNVSQSVKQIVESGKAVANHGRTRCAKITLDGDNLCLHHLQDKPPIDYAFAVQFDALLGRAIDSGLAFLDLSFGGSPPRRMYVRTNTQKNPDLARQFLYMCTGASGTSYAGTFLHVENQGQDLEMLVGGDYDGQGEMSVPGLTAATVEEPWTEGLVGVFQSTSDPTGIKFFITTRNSRQSEIRYTFGKVENGLVVAKEAAQFPDNDQIKVVTCGAVL